MADLSPDLSPYAALAKSSQSGIGSLGPGQLLNLIQASRELQTQSAASDALRASNGDPNAALQSLMRPGAPGFVSPELISHMANASQALTSAKMDQLRKTADFVAYQADDPDLDDAKVHKLVTTAVAGGGVPPEQGQAFLSTLPAPTGNKAADQKALKKALVDWQVTLTGGQPPGFGQLPGEAGGGIPMSQAAGAYVGRGLAPAPGTQGTIERPIQGPGGAPLFTAPTGMEKPLGASADIGTQLLASAKDLPNEYANLENLRSLSQEALSGPQTGFEERLNQLGQRFGVNITASAGKLAATEDYAKAAELLVQSSPAFGHSNAFLNNAYGTIPAKELSKLGREGITDWLLGNQDAKKFMIGQWQQWLSMPGHGAYSNQYIKWLNSKTMPDGSPGFDAPNFDPRVFQYARLSTYAKADDGTVINPRAEFSKRMTDTQRKTFVQHLKDYQRNGWVSVQ